MKKTLFLASTSIGLLIAPFFVHAQGFGQPTASIGQSCNTITIPCTSGLSCVSGTCKKTDVSAGGSCGTNSICAVGLTCIDQVCTAPKTKAGAGESCRGAGDCEDGLVCSSTGRCQVYGPSEQSGSNGSSNGYSPIVNPYAGSDTNTQGSSGGRTDNLFGVKNTILDLINNVFIPLLFSIAFLIFLFGVYKYFIYHGAEAKSHEDGRKYILYGIIGFAVMVSVWGLVNIVTQTFGTDGVGAPQPPLL